MLSSRRRMGAELNEDGIVREGKTTGAGKLKHGWGEGARISEIAGLC